MRNGSGGRPLNWVVSHQMRTREYRNNEGRLTGFEISNSIITRNGVQRVVTRIPGVSITQATHSWRWKADDDFLYFTLNGPTFYVIEPYGDSDCYCIFAKDAADIAEIGVVKSEFERHHVWKVI